MDDAGYGGGSGVLSLSLPRTDDGDYVSVGALWRSSFRVRFAQRARRAALRSLEGRKIYVGVCLRTERLDFCIRRRSANTPKKSQSQSHRIPSVPSASRRRSEFVSAVGGPRGDPPAKRRIWI